MCRCWISPAAGIWISLALSSSGVALDLPAGGVPPPTTSLSQPSHPVRDGLAIRVGNVRVDAVRKELRVPGWVNQCDGLVELLACGPSGKTHESVFILDVHAMDLQAGLLLLGCKAGDPMPAVGERGPIGSGVAIDVEWTEAGERRRAPAGRFLLDIRGRKKMQNARWTFTGSMIQNGKFQAETEASFVCVYWDPWGIVNLNDPLGSDDTAIAASPESGAELFQPVYLIFYPQDGSDVQHVSK